MGSLIQTEPCESCESYSRVWAEPPYWVCLDSPTRDPECQRLFATYDLEELARGVADDLAHHCRHVEAAARFELAEAIADAIDSCLFAVGGKLDVAAFLKLAEVNR